MQAYVLRRLLQGIPVLFVVSLIVFSALNFLPGDPVIARAGTQADPNYMENVKKLRHQMGLDRPAPERYLLWLGNGLRGDLGVSYITQFPVSDLIRQKLPASLELGAASLFIGLLIALPVGVIAAVRRNSWIDMLSTAFVTMGMAFPGFWLGIMLMLLFAVSLGWLPAIGYVPPNEDLPRNLRHLVLPAVTTGVILAAPIMRFLRSSMLEVLRQEYVTTARSKGLGETTVIVRHALKNALIPTLTVVGLQFGNLLGGLVIMEWVFAWPGIGWLTVTAVMNRDYSVVQGTVMWMATGFVLINLLVDVLYAALDPRIRYT